jgi:hypothetical protein
MSSGESMGFNIVVILVSAAAIGLSIANIISYNRIRTGTCGAVSTGEATTMLWLSVALIVLAAIPFLWAMWRLIMTTRYSCPEDMDMDSGSTHYVVHRQDTGQQEHHIVMPSSPNNNVNTVVTAAPPTQSQILSQEQLFR